MSSEHTLSIAQTDLALRSRPFSLKINRYLHFLKLIKGTMFKDCVYMVRWAELQLHIMF